ncbi:MAG TPA: YlxR family protein [Firmicutes bacterium]|nr:YlxR family protein [Bacillota bacterium]
MRQRRVPQRTCVGCRQVRAKKELVRIVRTPDGNVLVDPTGKASGRGGYICPSVTCLEQAVKTRSLDRALQIAVPTAVVEQLRQQLQDVRQ